MSTKLIAALYGDLPSTVADPERLVARLRSAGCTGVQLNLDDAAVAAAALRFGPGDGEDRPITGFISVWTEDAEAAVAALADLAQQSRMHVYRVTEHKRLDPPRLAD